MLMKALKEIEKICPLNMSKTFTPAYLSKTYNKFKYFLLAVVFKKKCENKQQMAATSTKTIYK